MSEFDDDYATCEDTYATLCIYLPEQGDPNRITERLGIKPSRIQRKGAQILGVNKQWPNGWFLSTKEVVVSKDVGRHIVWILEQLIDKEGLLGEMQREGCRMVVSCYWVSAHGHGGPRLKSGLMRRLAELDLEVGFDIYGGENIWV